MKKIITLIICMVLTIVTLSSCTKEKHQLIKLTDQYVENIHINIGLFDVPSDNTPNGTWKVGRVGRMVIVKCNEYIEPTEYERVKNMLQRRYKNKTSVRNVFINGGGTITIDCRY